MCFHSLTRNSSRKLLPLFVTDAGLACIGEVERNKDVLNAGRVSLTACGSAQEPPSWEFTMSINARFARTTILMLSLELLGVLQASQFAHADSPFTTPRNAVESQTGKHVRMLMSELHPFQPSLPTFVITHGMGGTESGDRFHQLADAIKEAMPGSNVILLDWSNDASKTDSRLGLPSPWEVAKSIDPVAKDAAECLKALGIDPAHTTFIGESFGNCVNAGIAEHLGRRGRILAFNPPNAAGGYKTPDLRTCADLAWSFQTYSIFDTQDQIAHVGFFLETHANATDRDQHVAGVAWLADRVRSDETNWLLMQYHPTETGVETFDAIAAISGELLTEKHPFRHRPPEVRSHSRASVPLVTSTP